MPITTEAGVRRVLGLGVAMDMVVPFGLEPEVSARVQHHEGEQQRKENDGSVQQLASGPSMRGGSDILQIGAANNGRKADAVAEIPCREDSSRQSVNDTS